MLSGELDGRPGPYARRPRRDRHALVRLCAHYFGNGAWLTEGELIAGAGRLAGVPGVLVHGRLDLGSPLETAWELAAAWQNARLTVIEDGGHLGTAATLAAVLDALDEFGRG